MFFLLFIYQVLNFFLNPGERDQQTQWNSAVRRIYRERQKARLEKKKLSDLALEEELARAEEHWKLLESDVDSDVDEDGYYERIEEDEILEENELVAVPVEEQPVEEVLPVTGTVTKKQKKKTTTNAAPKSKTNTTGNSKKKHQI
jgi:hypothetical protein